MTLWYSSRKLMIKPTLLLHPEGFQYMFSILMLISSVPYYVGFMSKPICHGILFELCGVIYSLFLDITILKPSYNVKPVLICRQSHFFAITFSSKINLGEH